MSGGDELDRGPSRDRARTLATLLLLGCALPANLTVTLLALLRGVVVGSPPTVAAEPKTILLSGGKMTKALALARSFHRAGHRVVLVEAAKYRLTGHRFSRAVDRFYTVPAPQDPGYVDALVRIVRRERVDVYVPVCSPAASVPDARAKRALAEHCEVVHVDADMVERLDDKDRFSAAASSLGLSVPDHRRVTRARQVSDFDFAGRPGRSYILKSIPYDPVRRRDLTRLPRPTPGETDAFARTLPISDQTPWIMQEFIAGQEYCTHSTVRDGHVQLYCCCESSPFQLNYEMVDKPEIEAWVKRFVGALRLTGQVSFDFIQAPDGTLYAIECNPRTHSAITMFHDHPGVARAYLDDGLATIEPRTGSRPTYWLYHELWRLLTEPGEAARTLRTIARGKDAIFDWADPLPFLIMHHAQIPWLLIDNLRRRRGWVAIDFNIGKLVEPAGD